jgi:hypothetical protein
MQPGQRPNFINYTQKLDPLLREINREIPFRYIRDITWGVNVDIQYRFENPQTLLLIRVFIDTQKIKIYRGVKHNVDHGEAIEINISPDLLLQELPLFTSVILRPIPEILTAIQTIATKLDLASEREESIFWQTSWVIGGYPLPYIKVSY